MVTQKEIAEFVGLDRSMVAHALRGDPRVAEATRLRVIKAAREMGYDSFSNGAARSLAAQRHGKRVKTGTIAILMLDLFEGMPMVDVPFFQEILSGIIHAAHERDLELSICVTPLGKLPRAVVEGNVDGALCIYDIELWKLLCQQPLPIPILNLGAAAPGEPAILPDDRQGIRATTRHLIEAGHRRIAYVGDYQLEASWMERLAGYRQALEQADIEVDETLMAIDIGAPSQRAGVAGFDTLQRRGVDFSAVVCFNDQSALGVIQRAQECGYRVPDDLSVAGFDGISETFGEGKTLTTARFDRFEMGRCAVRRLYRTEADNTVEIMPTELVVGDSTKPWRDSQTSNRRDL